MDIRETVDYWPNFELLQGQLKAVCAKVEALSVARLKDGGAILTAHLSAAPTQAEQAALQTVVDTHDPEALTAAQQAAIDAAAREAAANDAAATIPGWATWDEATTLAWLDANVTDLASAKVAIKAMARMLLALRDKNWPHLAA